jgi:hypothetical protein
MSTGMPWDPTKARHSEKHWVTSMEKQLVHPSVRRLVTEWDQH